MSPQTPKSPWNDVCDLQNLIGAALDTFNCQRGHSGQFRSLPSSRSFSLKSQIIIFPFRKCAHLYADAIGLRLVYFALTFCSLLFFGEGSPESEITAFVIRRR